MRVVHEHVAGIDVHKDMIKVAIRSPGGKKARRTEIFEFRTFYAVLQEVARFLRQRGVTRVVMEAGNSRTSPSPSWPSRSRPTGLDDAARLLATRPTRTEFFSQMLQRYPQRVNPTTVWLSAARLLDA